MKKIILIFAMAIIVSGCELKKLDWDKFIDENKTDKEVVDSDSEETVDTETPEPDTETPEIDHETIVDEETPDTKNDEIIEVDEDAQDDELIDDSEPIEPDENEVDEDVIEPFCGDGNKDQNEECDLGILLNTGEYGGCNSNCTFAERCGDGIKNGPEICDDGQINGTERFCNTLCTGSTTGAICTGQTKCYNETEEIPCPNVGQDFYGQDAQYLDKCVPRSYSITGTSPQEIVTDNNTGLQWQRTLPATYAGCTGGNPVGSACTRQGAINYCNELAYGGKNDWRLPEINELETLPDYGKQNPAIDDFLFPGTFANYFWSSSYHNENYSWALHFEVGGANLQGPTEYYYVRCVREAVLSAHPLNISTVSGDSIVTDSVTKLIWVNETVSGKTWKEAMTYCETLNYAGFTNWRLPNENELKSLINRAKSSPASDFPGDSYVLWSSTTQVEKIYSTYSINFSQGVSDVNGKTQISYTRCVR
ncbi:MAG: DUF1566 domain-containing protein [bacterium]|nr:DUF1566 domain-containing protein [bacterium]